MSTQFDKAAAIAERLLAAGPSVAEMAERHGTPYYLYSADMISERIERVRAALGTELLYSIKANPSLGVCQVIAGCEGVGAEVASSGELAVALAAGFTPEQLFFAGPGKTDEELERLVSVGIHADNIESLAEIERVAAVARRAGKRQGVALRINPEAQLMGAQMRMGGGATQFGIDEADLEVAVRTVLARPELELRGIHIYTATQVFDVAPLVEHCANVFAIVLRTADLLGAPLQMVDFGGGFGVPYFEKTVDFDLEAFGSRFRDLTAKHAADPRLEGTRFHFELGRYLVAEAGIYVMRVIDVKETRGTTFAITDGGMNHHLTATGNMGQVFRKSFPLANLTRIDEAPESHVAVVGPLCTPLDSFGQDVLMAKPQVGDLIGVFHSGAYGYSASNLGFLSHPTPAELLLRDGQLHLLRPAAKPEDVLSGQIGLS